jgi:putative polyhydroxyalkanoate system protein
MPKLHIEHPHSLEPAEVKQRLDSLSARLAQKYGIDAQWKSDTEATFKRTGASGTIRCHPDKVAIDVDLSFALTPMKGQVESRIRDELSRALA